MRILLLTQVLPYPPDSGPKIKTYHTLRYLAGHHEIHLVSFIRSPAELNYIPTLLEYCREVHVVPVQRSRWRDVLSLARSLLSSEPFIVVRDRSLQMARVVADLTDEWRFDVIHADQLTMAQYATPADGMLRVFDAHNAVWTILQQLSSHTRPGLRKWMLELEWRKVKRYEGRVGRQFDAILAVSEEDRDHLIAAGCPSARFTIIPIAVDTEEFEPVTRDPDASGVLHVGTMYWPPNIEGMLWFAKEVFPLVRERVSHAECFIVGARPPQEVVRLEDQFRGVHVTGYVNDLQPYLRKSAVFVVPLFSGSGMRVKILTAWAWGIPVVSTSIGCAGIPVHPGDDILVADGPAQFADAVVRVLEDQDLSAHLASNARRYVESHFDWRVVCRRLASLYPEGTE